MAKTVLTGCFVMINFTDWSDHVSKIEVSNQFEEKDTTTYGSGGAKEVLAGLENGTLGLTFKNDFAASSLDATMWALRGTLPVIKLRPSNAAVSSANPTYYGTYLVKEWKPISAAVGDVAEVDVSWTQSGVLLRLTTT
jgi:hypothetical protein